MNCERLGLLLSRYHDGDLDPRRREMVRAHLAQCSACAERLLAYEQIESIVSAAVSVAPSPTFRHSVLASTAARRVQEPVVPVSRRGSRPSQLFFGSLAGASIAALAVLVFALGARMGDLHSAGQPGSRRVAVAHVHAAVHQIGKGSTADRDVPAASISETVAATPAVARALPANARGSGDVLDRAGRLRVTGAAVIAPGLVRYPLWSPDGASLLYLTGFESTCKDSWYCGTLHLRGPYGSLTLATRVRGFAFSPDGRMVAYTTENSGAGYAAEPQDLRVVGLDGSGDHLLTTVDRTSVEWLRIGIVAARKGKMVLVDAASGRATSLASVGSVTIGDDDNGFMAVSANGRFLAYQDATGLRIWDRNSGGSLIVRQPACRLLQASFHFSWDGDEVFYSTYTQRGASGVSRLYRQRLAPLSTPVPLAGGASWPQQISLVGPPSADSSIVSFRLGSNADSRSYVLDVAAGRAHLLQVAGGSGPVGWWSPDGRSMVYVAYQGAKAEYSGIARVSAGS